MQIEGDQSVCPACGAEGLEIFPVLHHMICAYVGPQYDFAPAVAGYTCPKCRRDIVSGDYACDRRNECAMHPMSKGNGSVATVRFQVVRSMLRFSQTRAKRPLGDASAFVEIERGVDGFNGKADLMHNDTPLPRPGAALSVKEFANYRQDLIVGVSVQVSAPLGQYDSSKLLNLGNNRWSFKLELGISKAPGRSSSRPA
jgi:hypothetical protein